MGTLTHDGRAALALAVKNQGLFMAMGSGSASWDENPPRESRSASRLTAEIGRRKASEIAFCLPDADGEIVTLDARFRRSEQPTPNLYVRGDFDFNDGLGENVREIGLFLGSKAQSQVARGKRFLLPQDLAEEGILLMLEHVTAIPRGVGAKLSFEFVLNF